MSKLANNLTWVFLSNIRNSFFAKATSIFAFSSLILSNSDQVLEFFDFKPFELFLLFTGSVIFILGYILFWVFSPQEFRLSGEIHDHVQRMKNIEDVEFLKSRISMAQNMQNRLQGFSLFKVPQGILLDLQTQIKKAQKTKPVDLSLSAGVYRADLQARNFDFPIKRIVTAFPLLLGGLMLISTTIVNAFEVILGAFT